MSVDFNAIYPWSDIQAVTIDGQAMVKIPAFYVKVGKAADGTTAAGRKCYWISDKPRSGFHLHPAFMRAGKAIPCFYFGGYEASADGSKAASLAGKSPWVNITIGNSRAACAARNTGTGDQAGWHLNNVYERSAISLLMMIELGTADVQTAINSGNVSTNGAAATGGTKAVWRNIHEFWGNVDEWVDGMKFNNYAVSMWDNKGNQTYVTTGATVPSGSGAIIKDMWETSGESFDLNDVFVPKTTTSGAGNYGSDGVWSNNGSDNVLDVSGTWGDGARAGAFLFGAVVSASDAYSNFGFRLAKYPES